MSTGCQEADEAGPTAGAQAGHPARVQAQEAGRPGTVERMGQEIATVAAYRRMDGVLALLGFTCTREGRQPAGRHTHTHMHSHLRALPQGHGASLVRWKPREASKQRNIIALSSGKASTSKDQGRELVEP